MSPTYILGIIFAMIVLVSIFLRMRNSGMKEAYATWWIVISLGCVVFALIPGGLRAVSSRLGVEVPLNLGFFVAGIIMLLPSEFLTSSLNMRGANSTHTTLPSLTMSATWDGVVPLDAPR